MLHYLARFESRKRDDHLSKVSLAVVALVIEAADPMTALRVAEDLAIEMSGDGQSVTLAGLIFKCVHDILTI